MDNLQTLLNRKHKADSLPTDIKRSYAEHYKLLISEIAKHAINNQLPAWDEEVNSEILRILLIEFAKKYGMQELKPAVEQIFLSFDSEVNESFRARDQVRFFECVQMTREKLRRL